MKKRNRIWSIGEDLKKKYSLIEFAEYQREPTVWDLKSKQKLIDSILREYDFANIYLYYRPETNRYECIDGRQRLSAMLSFIGLNEAATDNKDSRIDNNFIFRSSDELFGKRILKEFDNKRFEQFTTRQQERFLSYNFNVVEITGIEEDEDLNLMFLRLQLGAALNGGEKLKAMKGYMRDAIFKDLGAHKYFHYLSIPARRFSPELTAAQVAVNYWSLKSPKADFSRARFIDLQDFFRLHAVRLHGDTQIMADLKEDLDRIYAILPSEKKGKLVIKNRAMGVSAFFALRKRLRAKGEVEAIRFVEFLKRFIHRLDVEVKKGDEIPQKFRYLLKFQAYVSQAPVERVAFAGRDKLLDEYFKDYVTKGRIRGE
jgi:hypothetical protein